MHRELILEMRERSASAASARTTARSVVVFSIGGRGSGDGAAEAAMVVGSSDLPIPTVLSAGIETIEISYGDQAVATKLPLPRSSILSIE